MIKNFSLTLESIAEATAKIVTAAQQKSLDAFVKVILHNKTDLNSPLAEQGSVCAVANPSCCAWLNTSGEVETRVLKIIASHLA